ncbi:MAG TPA: tetratricopeptide repeat protein [Candidatus Acidoferrales bacterium]|nr:tetratricopeptide repeat protein [Candidatus Acidoferrales bacterium]
MIKGLRYGLHPGSMRRLALVVGCGVMLTATLASASEQSRRLYARGLVEFHTKRYATALDLFERAVAADPDDPYALYYRGVTRGRLGNYEGAVEDLRAVVARNAALRQAPLELGVALVQWGKYGEAIPWLEQAQRVPRLEARASLFLGVAQLRLERFDAALQSFARADEHDPSLHVAARYYEGVAAYRMGQWSTAEDHFGYVVATSPSSAMGREAATFLTDIRQGQVGHADYQVYGALGFQYDSNVVLAPSNEAVKTQFSISKQADGRFTLQAGGAYVAWRSEHAQLSVGYDFFQSLHFRLTDFNLQDHRPSAQIQYDTGFAQLGLLGRYDYYLLDTDSFLQEAVGLPWVTIPEGGFGSTELFYRMRRRDFFKLPYNGLLDAFNHSAGVQQLFYLGAPDRYVSVGYRFDRDDPINAAGDPFGYDGNEMNVGIGWTFPSAINAEAGYVYRHEAYDSASNGRHDDDHQFVAAASKRLTEHLMLTAAYFGTIDHSNQSEFTYNRHIGSLTLEVRF